MNNNQQHHQTQQGISHIPFSLVSNSTGSRERGGIPTNSGYGVFQAPGVASSVQCVNLPYPMMLQQKQQPKQGIQQANILRPPQQLNTQQTLVQQQPNGLQQITQATQQLLQLSAQQQPHPVAPSPQAEQATQLSSVDVINILKSAVLRGIVGGTDSTNPATGQTNALASTPNIALDNRKTSSAIAPATSVPFKQIQPPISNNPIDNKICVEQDRPQQVKKVSGSPQFSGSGAGIAQDKNVSAAPGENVSNPHCGLAGNNNSTQNSSMNKFNKKEETEKGVGFTTVPCGARGMPTDHMPKTAYLVIRDNIQHGEELFCSYLACRNAGVKFRYCSYCSIPVGKKNFRQRHAHVEDVRKEKMKKNLNNANDQTGANKGADGRKCDEITSTTIATKPQAVIEKRCTPEQYCVPCPSSSTAEESKQLQVKTEERLDAAQQQDGSVSSESGQSSNRSCSAAQKRKTISSDSDSISMHPPEKRHKTVEKKWLDLLYNRPSSKASHSMSEWLMEVMNVSDLILENSSSVVKSETKNSIAASTDGNSRQEGSNLSFSAMASMDTKEDAAAGSSSDTKEPNTDSSDDDSSDSDETASVS